MEPIISPWLIYTISILDSIARMSVIFILGGLVSTVFALLALVYTYSDTSSPQERKETHKKFTKISLAVLIISMTINAAIPSKNTMIAMVVSSYVTPDNLSYVNEVFKANLKDYIQIITDGINNVGK